MTIDGMTSSPAPESPRGLVSNGAHMVRSGDRVQSVRLGDYMLRASLLPNRFPGMVELIATNGDGSVVAREVFPQTDQGIESIRDRLAVRLREPSPVAVAEVIRTIVYSMSGRSTAAHFEPLLGSHDDEPEVFRVEPLVLVDEVTILLGPTGQTKTIQSAAIAIAAATGTPIGPHQPLGSACRVLILDGETTRTRWAEIVRAIATAHDIDPSLLENISYHRVERPIAGYIEDIRQWVDDEGFGLVIVDSVDSARGGEAVSATGHFFDLLRYIGTSVLAVDHIPLDLVRQKDISNWRSLGSVAAQNRARQTHGLKLRKSKGQADSEIRVKFQLIATNRGVPGQSFEIPMRFTMSDSRYDTIWLGEPDQTEQVVPNQQEETAIAIRNLNELGERDVKPQLIAEYLGRSGASVRSDLQNLRKQKWVESTEKALALTEAGVALLDEKWEDDLPPVGIEDDASEKTQS